MDSGEDALLMKLCTDALSKQQLAKSWKQIFAKFPTRSTRNVKERWLVSNILEITLSLSLSQFLLSLKSLSLSLSLSDSGGKCTVDETFCRGVFTSSYSFLTLQPLRKKRKVVNMTPFFTNAPVSSNAN